MLSLEARDIKLNVRNPCDFAADTYLRWSFSKTCLRRATLFEVLTFKTSGTSISHLSIGYPRRAVRGAIPPVAKMFLQATLWLSVSRWSRGSPRWLVMARRMFEALLVLFSAWSSWSWNLCCSESPFSFPPPGGAPD